MPQNNFYRWMTTAMVGGSLLACSSQNFGVPDSSQQFAASVQYNNKVDIIMMMDNSSSMLQYQTKFANEVPSMLANLNQQGLDYHIAVVTTDMRPSGNGGQLIGTPNFLTNSTPNLTALLQSRVTIGEAGSDLERGLQSIETVLQPSYLTGNGAGFLRDDALLAMVALSNEDDSSADSVATLETFFDSLKRPFPNGSKSWIMNFVGVLSIDGQCATTADYKEAGLRWMELTEYSGGIESSICDTTLALAVANIRSRIVEVLSEYPLKSKPILSSIAVHENGALVPMDATNGWTYDAATNSIRFHGTYLPAATSNLHVDYSPDGGN